MEQSLRKMRGCLSTLRGGDWIGQGARKFYQEMDSEVLPAVQRLTRALQEGAHVTKQISKIMKQAEDDAARVFQILGVAAGSSVRAGIGEAALLPEGASGLTAPEPDGAQTSGTEGGEQLGTPSPSGTVSERMLPGFDARTRELVEQSPTLRGELERLERENWDVEHGGAGDGSSADRANTRVIIDPGDSPEYQVGGIAHETAHALYGEPPYHAPTAGMTREEYVRDNVAERVRDEGNAQLHEYEIRQEILDNGGPDIGISGSHRQRYDAVYNDYRDGTITREQAVEQMGNIVFDDVPSGQTGTPQTYRQIWRRHLGDRWDREVAPTRRNP